VAATAAAAGNQWKKRGMCVSTSAEHSSQVAVATRLSSAALLAYGWWDIGTLLTKMMTPS